MAAHRVYGVTLSADDGLLGGGAAQEKRYSTSSKESTANA